MLAGPQTRILGMMSGTSVDSVDAALCDVDESPDGRLTARLVAFGEHPIAPALRQRIFELFRNGPGSLALACSLNFEIAEAFADAALALFTTAGVDRASVTAIASHGQTAWHIPPHAAAAAGHVPSTLQVGDGAVIAERTGLRVVCDFRTADMAAGGNGAPLVPFGDFHLFSRPGEAVVVHNVGGIANCTVLPGTGRLADVTAFDTGPGNMILDALARRFWPDEPFDRDGNHAQSGTVIAPLLDAWMAEPYIALPPPKSTGRELFGEQFAARAVRDNPTASPEDLLATATAFTARSTAGNLADHVLARWPVAEVLLAGGGAQNPFLVERITEELRRAAGGAAPRVRLLDDTGWPAKARECAAFALLGHARLRGIPGNVPSATGARRPVLLGKIVDPG